MRKNFGERSFLTRGLLLLFANAHEKTCTYDRNHINSHYGLLGYFRFCFAHSDSSYPTAIGASSTECIQIATSHFSKSLPQVPIDILSRTFKFNPFEQPNTCSHTMIRKAGVPESLPRQLGDLGDAEYLFKDNPPVGLHIPWKYKLTDLFPDLSPSAFHRLTFSRVAFSRDRRQALFAVSDACAYGDCGRGGAVYANKGGGTWKF